MSQKKTTSDTTHFPLPNFTKQQIAARYGCSVERINEQYRANAAQMARMAEKATATGKKVNGYTAEQLHFQSERFFYLANANF